ncbi:hypothetical protein C8F01DRAFT_1364241 [Mycena amicta]|nr:hypothetical protein C8F01DRAFT_1364241 [Mycena amicta]
MSTPQSFEAHERRHILGHLSRKVLQKNTIVDENSEPVVSRRVPKARSDSLLTHSKLPVPPPMSRVVRSIPTGALGLTPQPTVSQIPIVDPLTPSENRAILCLSSSVVVIAIPQPFLVLSDERQTPRNEIDALSSQIAALHRDHSAIQPSVNTPAAAASQTSLVPPSNPTHTRSNMPRRGTYHIVRELGPDTPDEAILRVCRRKSYQEPSTQFENGSDMTPLW